MNELNNEDILVLLVSEKADGESRTPDLLITNQALYQLSYIGFQGDYILKCA
jgi:hypothetical protein